MTESPLRRNQLDFGEMQSRERNSRIEKITLRRLEPNSDVMTPGINEKSPPAEIERLGTVSSSEQVRRKGKENLPQNPLMTAKAIKGPSVTAKGQIARQLTVTSARQSRSELRLPSNESANNPNAIRPPADDRL